MKKFSILIILICLAFIIFPAPKAQAMDPVTIALLAPIAIKAAKIASPYILRGLLSGAKHMLVMGKDLLSMMRFPLGFAQVTFLAPFGQLKSGVKNLLLGSIAPIKFGFHALLLPVALTGIKVN
jgi:hypothetical protein